MKNLLFLSFIFLITACHPSDAQLDNNIKNYAEIMQLKVLAYSCNGHSSEILGCASCDIKTDEGIMPLTCCDDFCKMSANTMRRH